MKKVVSMLVAIATVLGISTAAFAADNDIVGITGSTELLSHPNTITTYTQGLTGDFAHLRDNELVLVQDKTNDVILPETRLEPGTEYILNIFYVSGAGTADGATVTAVTDADLGGGKLRLRGVKGTSAISSAKIVKRGSGNAATYRLELNTKENWNTKLTDVEYTLSVTGSAVAFEQGNISLEVGYGRFTDEEIDSFGEGDIVTISNDAPVILKKQFETLSKTNNYKAIDFDSDDGAWSYIGRVSGMGDTNFKYKRDVITAIADRFEDQDFEFLTFGAGVTFPTNGEMRIDVSDFSDDFYTMYTYLYRDGKLTPINTTYDTGADELVFRTNYLGSFVITDEEVTDLTIINTGNDNDNIAETVPEPENINPENPQTGTTGVVSMAVAMGIISIAAAGAVSRKRK